MWKKAWDRFLNNYLKKAWAPTIVVTLIFFVTYFGFGAENSMIAPFATLAFLRFRDLKRHYSCIIKTYGIFCIMVLAAHIAVFNLPLCIIVNALALFWICALLIDEYQLNNYFPPAMALIFFQMSPVKGWMAVGNRMLAMAVSFLIIFAFLYLLNLTEKEDILESLAAEGQQDCYRLYKAVREEDGEEAERLRGIICRGNRRMSSIIYAANRASLIMYGEVNTYCRYVALFEAVTFESKGRGGKEHVLKEMEILLQRIAYLKANEIPDNRTLQFRDGRFDLKLTRYRFGIRQILIVVPTLVFAYMSGWKNAYWLTISVFFMLVPFYENTGQRVKARVFGTLRGIIFCMLLFFVFRSFPARVAIMTVFNFLIYTASGYESMVSYITCSALALNAMQSGVGLMLLQRVAYTLIGAGITVLANRYVFPVKLKPAIAIIKEKLAEIMYRLEHEIPYIEDRNKKWHCVNECVIKAYMMGNTLTEYDGSEENRRFLQQYMHEVIQCIKGKIDKQDMV